MQGCKFEYAERQLTSGRRDSKPVIPCNVHASSIHAHKFLSSSAPQLAQTCWQETQPSGTRDPHIFVDFIKDPIFDVKAGA